MTKILPISIIKKLTNEQLDNLTFIEFDSGMVTDYIANQDVTIKGKLLCPKKTFTNNLKEIHQHNMDWIIKTGLLPDNIQTRENLNNVQFSYGVYTMLKNCKQEYLELYSDCFAFFVLLDDNVDRMKNELSLNEYEGVFNIFINILHDKYEKRNDIKFHNSFPKFKEFCNALFDINTRLKFVKSDRFYFIKSVEIYLKGLLYSLYHSLNISTTINFNYADYFYLRDYDTGIDTAIEAGLLLNNIQITNKERESYCFQLIRNIGSRIITILNDIASLKKEFTSKEKNIKNIVLVYKNQYNEINEKHTISLQESFDYVVKWYNQELVNFMLLEKQISTESDSIKKYHWILKSIILDNTEWYFKVSKRYLHTNTVTRDISV